MLASVTSSDVDKIANRVILYTSKDDMKVYAWHEAYTLMYMHERLYINLCGNRSRVFEWSAELPSCTDHFL
jgi:hypothetical protein